MIFYAHFLNFPVKVIDDFDKIDRLTSKSRVKVEHDPTRKSIMDDLLKETFESSENPSHFKATNDFGDKYSNQNKKPVKKQEEEEEEDVLENVIKSFEKKEENIAKGLEIADDPEDLIKQFEETEKVILIFFLMGFQKYLFFRNILERKADEGTIRSHLP